eukprot:753414-Hanusia_phi.AAC.2
MPESPIISTTQNKLSRERRRFYTNPLPLISESARVAKYRGLSMIGLSFTPKAQIGVAAVWTVCSVAYYIFRRSRLHTLPKREILRRHFVNQCEEPRHPCFLLAVMGWLVFLLFYIPLQCILDLFGFVALYYYYPAAYGAGVLIEKSSSKMPKEKIQVIRLDWHRFKLPVEQKTKQGRWCGYAVFVNLPHIDIPSIGKRKRHPDCMHGAYSHQLLLNPSLLSLDLQG